MYIVYSTTKSPLPYPNVLIVDGEPALAVNVPERLVVIPTFGAKPVKFAPLTAGKVAGNLASGIVPDAKSDASRFVRLAPLIAGKAPDNFDAVSVDILASATVPVS